MALLFKTQKPRGFKFEPRYYDERKEAFEARVERIKSEMGMAEHVPGATIRGSFQQARSRKPINLFGAQISPVVGKIFKLASIVLIGLILYFVYMYVVNMMNHYQIKQAKRAAQIEQQRYVIEE